MTSETENRARGKFLAALHRRALTLTTQARNIKDHEAAKEMARMARQARRDGLADIAEIRRQAEKEFERRIPC